MIDVVEVAVTLPVSLLRRLRREARNLGLPTAWVIADFIAALADEQAQTSPA